MKVNNAFFYYFFLAYTLLSITMIYSFGSAILAYLPILLVSIFAIIIIEKKFTLREWIVLIVAIIFSLYTFAIFFLNPYEGKIISGYSISLLMFSFSLFFVIYSYSHIPFQKYSIVTANYLLAFVLMQFVICLGQTSTYYLGFGFPVKQDYSEYSMVTGAFNNANDFAAILVIISYIFSNLEKYLDNYKIKVFWFVVLIMMVLLGSRAALVLILLILLFSRKNGRIKSIFITTLVFILIISISYISEYMSDSSVLGRVAYRLNTFINIFNNGIESDGSISLRYESYKHFIKIFYDVGFGSGSVRDYSIFNKNATFDTSLLLKNPHSLFIEIAYWSGYFGLFLILLLLILLFLFFNPSFIYLLIVLLTSMISSGALWSPIYILMLILGFFISDRKEK